MTAGSSSRMGLLSRGRVCIRSPAFYAVWALLGVASAAVLYEPAFAVVATWFRRDRGRALTLLTFIGGFASVVFVPLATLLVERFGWRDALLWLGGHLRGIHGRAACGRAAASAVGSGARAGWRCPRRGTVDACRHQAASIAGERRRGADAIRSQSFRWLAVAFALSALTTTAITVHLVPLLRERGYGAGFAGGAMGVLGLMALPGRLIFTPLGGRWSRAGMAAVIFVLSGLAIVTLLVGHGPAAVWVFVALFGAGFGAITPARAALLAESFGAASYAEISGVLTLVLSLTRAAAPVGASILYESSRGLAVQGYDAVLVVLALLAIGSALAVLAAKR